MHAFDLGILQHAKQPVLAANAALLIAAERRSGKDHMVVVDPDRTSPQPPRDLDRRRDIAGPDGGPKSIGALVCQCNDLAQGLLWDHNQHWPKDLLVSDPHLIPHPGEDRRLKKRCMLKAGHLCALSPKRQRRALA